MTYGSSHRRCESNVQAWVKPASSARRAQSTTDQAGGSHCSTTPKSRPATSARPGEPEVDRRGRRVGPAGGDDLGLGVEVDALGPVHVAVAEERVLPAPEAVVADGYGDGDVDPDHAAV